ncbi:putative pyridoxal phosphate-dependent aminotransferase epsN [Nitrospina gracilis 3/211]|uniref:GDP-perosamine synthase n=1 Tax=Nitrospina gracilis (strain 3/211) TaxID=1266370 RepID=M1YWZ4_NITG3|nr:MULTISPECIES: aminotransferase class I/II-fold pyridoxal phosphate-dependent enzyme [Nitrospina]MCF8722852.1 pyridoxal phosphate-dependent aminotransferase EpsN [Nitrospina sp. Nb-3]CCQ89812.1 putative pyridoxal phosphate-dependent aminotransferase epsN [Nitrospina gracilis 3/211]
MSTQPPRIYLSPPHLGGQERQFVEEAFQSNWIAPCGPNQEAFEAEMAAYVGAPGALALSSGTAAIHLALRLCGVEPGDTVFCPSLTFIGSATPIQFLGADPVFIDSDPATWNLSPQALERALKEAGQQGRVPKAVIAVNLYGQNADMDAIQKACDKYRVLVIEDAAESLGATYRGKASGTLGKFGIYSFNGNKIITTSGGGMLVSKDTAALDKARYWATQARDPVLHYEHSELGYNYRMSNVLAAIGRGQLKVLDERIAQRRAVFDRYRTALESFEGIEFMPEAGFGTSTRWLTVLTLDRGLSVKPHDIIAALDRENIEARPVWKPLHLQPLFKGCTYHTHADDCNFSENVFERGFCLPSGSNLAPADQDRIIDIVQSVLKRG